MRHVYTNIQRDQKVKLDYHMSMLFAFMVRAGGWGWGGGGGGGGGRRVGREVGSEVLKCFVRGGQNFYYAPEGTSGGILKSLCPSVRYNSCLSDIS